MAAAAPLTLDRPVIAFGPEAPGFGSWDWVGQDMADELASRYRTVTYKPWAVPRADLVIVVKHVPPPGWLEEVARQTPIFYCPVDNYGAPVEIFRDAPLLRRCACIVVHCERLRSWFVPYAPVVYLDHHVKFVAPLRQVYRPQGFILWVGVRSNLATLVEWVNEHPLPAELRVLTNPAIPGSVPAPEDLGFRRDRLVRIAEWTPQRQVEWTAQARAAIDVKDQDFRSWHKPPVKAIDFMASGVPVALSPGHCAREHLARLGFEVVSPLDEERWVSRAYQEETRCFGAALRELLSRERVGRRLAYLIDEVLVEWQQGLEPPAARNSAARMRTT